MTVRHIFGISEDDHPSLVTHARDNWWTLDFANAFVSPGVNSRGELVPSHGASRRRLGEYGLAGPIQATTWRMININIQQLVAEGEVITIGLYSIHWAWGKDNILYACNYRGWGDSLLYYDFSIEKVLFPNTTNTRVHFMNIFSLNIILYKLCFIDGFQIG
jgi:hypothetical protein